MEQKTDIVEELNKLNERFYALYGRLHQYRENLSKEQYDLMLKRIYETYRSEYERMQMRCEIDLAREEYELNVRRGILMPRRRWSWRHFHRMPNYAAVIIENAVDAETERYFAERESEIYQKDEEGEHDPKDDTMSEVEAEKEEDDTMSEVKTTPEEEESTMSELKTEARSSDEQLKSTELSEQIPPEQAEYRRSRSTPQSDTAEVAGTGAQGAIQPEAGEGQLPA
jgi:hypothetical protein